MHARFRFDIRLLALLLIAFVSALWLPKPALAQVAPADQGSADAIFLQPARQDATIAQQFPTTNFGAQTELRVGVAGVEPALATWSLAQWDLDSIPAGSTINSAKMDLYQTTGAETPLLIYRVLVPWDELKVTWNTRPRIDDLNLTCTPSALTNQTVTCDVTELVKQWVNGGANTPNHGLMLRAGGAQPSNRVFASVQSARATQPLLQIDLTLPRIRVCYETAQNCKPAPGAEVLGGAGRAIAVADSNGLIDSNLVVLGDALWARLPAGAPGAQSQLYITSGRANVVDAADFQLYPDSDFVEMRLVVREDQPLLLYDLTVSAQWYLEDDPARVLWLRSNLLRASNYLYDFTEGQFALGRVTVRQMYEGWDDADIKLHTSNVLHPNANVGGIVPAETPDIWPTVPLSYTPGSVFMGSYWNRFGAPPGQEVKFQGEVVPQDEMDSDWAIALAHELGHYLLFLFDTYTDQNGVSNETIAAQCSGTAMGNAYLVANHALIAGQEEWDNNCAATEAHFLLEGRTEWATIQGWYNWAVAPASIVPGETPPVQLTTVVFVPPATQPQPLASQVYSLTYQLGEASSGEARAFLLRGDSLIFEQGKPAQGATSLQLVDARLGDRLCLFDLNDHAASPDTPRRQFGCETVTAGDSNLQMTLDLTWSPRVTIEQTGPQQVSVVVEQNLAAGESVAARLIPETGTAIPTQTLAASGSVWSTVFTLAEPVMPFYLQLWVDETPAAPQTRREVIADRGTGGNGAYGPARLHSGVMAVSSDGNASYQSDEAIDLGPGESIAWQSMPGTPPLPAFKGISGQSYRLDAFPAALVVSGTVSIEYIDEFGVLSAARQADETAAIHFWNGSRWQPLTSTVARPAAAEDDVLVATARSQGVGVYAVLIDSQPALFLPQIAR